MEQSERFARAWTKIDLIAQRDDALGRVLFTGGEHGFQRGQIGMDVGDEQSAHKDPPEAVKLKT